MPQDRSRPLLRGALVAVALGVALTLALELGARRLGFGPGEPVALGARSERSFRIVALGASTVAGVPDGTTGFVAQLTTGLRHLAPDREVVVANLARPGASSDDVRRQLDRALAADPDLVIALTGHNEYLKRRSAQPLRRALQELRDASALMAAVDAAAAALGVATGGEELFPERLEPIDRAADSFRVRQELFRANLDAMSRRARARGVPLILCTAPANLLDWPPVYRRIAWASRDPHYDESIAALEADLAAGNAEKVIAEGLGWTERFGNDAMVSWLRGRALRELGRTNGARAALRAAIELDPFPLRALGAFNDAVRAQDGEGVRVADVEKRLASYAPDGLVGFDLICDNCHPTPLGAALAAREVARTMASEGWLLAPDTRLGSARSWLERHERQLGGSKRRRRVRWLLSNGVYAMKTPFFHFPVARGYLERARDLDPRSWQAWANLATLSLLEGDLAGGRRELQRATALKGSPLDPADRGRVPYLAEALRRASAAGGS